MTLLRRAFALLAGLLACSWACAFVIPASGRADMVHDFKRNRIYITAGNSVLRYDRASASFLAPITIGGSSLQGIDISLDGDKIAVADGGSVVVRLIDLNTLAITNLTDTPAAAESGTFSVAFGVDGSILETGSYAGSGWVPLRRFVVGSGGFSVQTLSTITQNTMIAASGDRTHAGLAQSNISNGPWERYTFGPGTIEGGADTNWFNYEIGTNRNGTQFAVPTYGGTFFYDDHLAKIGTIGTYAGQEPVGVAYHPVENLVYCPWAQTSQVKVYDTSTLLEVGSIPMSRTFTWGSSGPYLWARTKLSIDGSVLMVGVDGGIEVVDLYAPLSARNTHVRTAPNVPVSVNLPATIGNGAALQLSLGGLPPDHGSVMLSGSTATYTPNADFSGHDHFTFTATYGTAQVQGTVYVTVAAAIAAPKVDFDGDGHADLLVRHADGTYEVRLMNGTAVKASGVVSGTSAGHVIALTGDFDGDGKTDLLYQRDDGGTEMWLMDGTTITQVAQIMPPGLGWTVAHVGDFDGNGKSDLLWRNDNGATGMWLMSGATQLQRATLQPAGSAWTATQLGDFDGDGMTDILWQGADGTVSMWLMNGTAPVERGPILAGPNASHVLNVGDLNGDGLTDILWQNDDGSVSAWLMDGRAAASYGALMGANSSWTVSHVADFNGDGKADLLWLARDGTVGMWLMDGLGMTQRATQMPAGTGWTLNLAQDLDGDRNADLVWSHSSGAVGGWIMSGTTMLSHSPLEAAGSTSSVVPLRPHR